VKGGENAMRKSEEEEIVDQGEPSPEAQARALDDAWKKGIEEAKKDPEPCRFKRRTPILDPRQDRRMHHCSKRRARVYFAICWNESCGHFHPNLPADDGSCDFRPKRQKDAEKVREDRKKEREENEKRGDDEDRD
jgi:hypothetical protein